MWEIKACADCDVTKAGVLRYHRTIGVGPVILDYRDVNMNCYSFNWHCFRSKSSLVVLKKHRFYNYKQIIT